MSGAGQLSESITEQSEEHLNLRHARAFEAAGRLRSLNQAATAIHMSQSAVTYAIRSLEDYFGSPLMTRDARGSDLTAAGEIVHARLAALLARLDDTIVSTLRDGNRPIRKELGRIGWSLNWHQLLAVVAVARARRLEAAAHVLNRSEASISRRLRELEQLFGMELFLRTPGGVSANKLGMRLSQGVSVALKELDYAKIELQHLAEEEGGTISFGCLGLARTALVPGSLETFLKGKRRVSVRMLHDSFHVLLEELCYGEIDFLVCAKRDGLADEGFVGELLFSDSYSVICRQGHPLTKRKRIDLTDLMQYEWVLPMRGTPFREACDRIFGQAGGPGGNVIETHSSMTSWAILRSTDRLSISSHRDLASNGQDRFLTTLQYDLPVPARSIYLYRRDGLVLPRLHSELIDVFRRSACRL